MSVRFNNYIMRGVLCPYGPFRVLSDELEEELEKYCDTTRDDIKHYDGICMLFDGMGGRYVAIGKVLVKSECGEGFNQPLKVDDEPIDDEVDVMAKINAILDKIGQKPLSKLRTLVISHYR